MRLSASGNIAGGSSRASAAAAAACSAAGSAGSLARRPAGAGMLLSAALSACGCAAVGGLPENLQVAVPVHNPQL